MTPPSLAVKTLLSAGLSLSLLATASTSGHGLDGTQTTVSITSVSGYAGHAFVYAQVSDSTLAYPAPTGTGHQSPFFSEWVAQPTTSEQCPWIWAVYVFNRATKQQINLPPPNAASPNFGTTTFLCASPTTTPVDQPPQADASARLDLDLQVAISPPVSAAGSTRLVSSILNSALTQDLNLYLSMAIEDWSVTQWAVDFGDGQQRTVDGPVGTSVQLPHIYQSPGRYDARTLALISGHAQAAVYDRYGTVHLVRRSFSVQIGNHALAIARPVATRSYLAPQGMVAVVPYLGTAIGPAPPAPFRHIDVLRGALTTLSVHLLIVREGLLVVDGVPRGFGHSRLIGWRFEGPPSDAPPGTGTSQGTNRGPSEPMRLQWNSPDRILHGQLQDYAVPVTLFVETGFPDGHVGSYLIRSSFSVTVDFAAESG